MPRSYKPKTGTSHYAVPKSLVGIKIGAKIDFTGFILIITKNNNMKVNPLAITRYKIHKWFDRKKKTDFYGLDVIIDGKSYHVADDKPVWFPSKSEAIKAVRKMNKELRAERSVATTEA